MQKVGMSFEGIAREKMFAKGRYWDVKQYAILLSDWENGIRGSNYPGTGERRVTNVSYM
ncbi:MAG: ydaF [Neobacillus sp.]|nr:ydaF [Neobacillus sp.]